MEQSECIDALAKALNKVQANELFALTDKANPFFKSKYADLSSVWSVARKPLIENGLSVVQTFAPSDGNSVVIVTTLLHESGQWIRGSLNIPTLKADPQATGSSITYGRRYSLSALLGICPEDDDGEKGMARTKYEPNTEPVKIPDTEKSKGKSTDLSPKQWGLMKKLAFEKQSLDEKELIHMVEWLAQKENLPMRHYKIAKMVIEDFDASFQKYNEFMSSADNEELPFPV